MAITNAQTKRWAQALKIEAAEASILPSIANKSWQVDAVGASSIDIIGIERPAITPYVKGVDLTYPELTDNKVTILIDQYRKFQFRVNTIDLAQTGINYVPESIAMAGQDLGLEADIYGFGSTTYADEAIPADNKFGTLAVPVAITSANVLTYLGKLATALRNNHVMTGGYVEVNPGFMNLIREASLSLVTDNAGLFASRSVARYAGLTIVETTEVAKDATADGYQIMAFSPRAIAYVSNVQEIETLMNPVDFGQVVRGLYAFGTKVVFPKEVAVLSCTLPA
jgi:hypothetical protein